MKMKKIHPYFLAAIFVASLFYSCDKEFLDVLPRGEVIAKTTADFRKILDYVDNSRYAYSLSLTMQYVDIISDDMYMDSAMWNGYTATSEHIKNLYVYKNNIWTYSNPASTADEYNWKYPYYISSLCNSILTEIPKANDNIILQKQLTAEAKVHIAYAYLQLVNLFAPQYVEATAASTKGVPIVVNPASLPSLNRKSVKEVYDFILKNLLEAAPDLPDDVNQYKHRPTKTSTYAILARTYLYMGNYTKALEYADKSLNIRSYLYDYNTIYTGTVDYYGNLIGLSRMTDEEMLLWKVKKGTTLTTFPYTRCVLDSGSFNKLYPDFIRNADSTLVNYDLRRTLKFDAVNLDRKMKTANKGMIGYLFDHYNYRYKIDGNKGGTVQHMAVSTPEMYLIRAECNARGGKLQEALNDINAICMKRYATSTFTALTLGDFQNDKTKVLERVLLERRRELYGKDLRLFDLKRLNLSFSHNLGPNKISIPANDTRMVWSIFTNYIDMNSELEQYDRTNTGVKYYDKDGNEIPETE